ncbi:protein phosphatase 2C domain-containing protein [Streptomyces sp. 130]|uniref:protein phosphatase 2C domain-containing protein n=1 Tax=Streptomyces sp. 130 TaxID=2591006 RepID=UPI00117FF323|nr:protein phosphatase 2C domain-containing protein [Streptomyces sp. 130]TRV79740.1 protein phosphatase 2C domain-containing protein [Streptomyces sp. 130]
MSQQGERPAAREDDWWRRLYDDSAPDAGAAQAADSLDDRFDSASGTVATGKDAANGTPLEIPEPREEPQPAGPDAVARRPGEKRPDPGARAPSAVRAPARAPWEPLTGPALPRTFPGPAPEPPPPDPGPEPPAVADPRLPGGRAEPPLPGRPVAERAAADGPAAEEAPAEPAEGPRPLVAHVGARPPTYDAEPTALPATDPYELDRVVPDTVLDGATYGTYTLRAASVRGDSARFRGEPRRDALLTARFGSGENALVLVAVAGASRGAQGAHTAAADACHWIGEAVGRSHSRLSDDIRAGRRADLKSGLHRLTDRAFGKLRARAAELGVEPAAYSASLRCLLLPADPGCRTRVFFGIGAGGLFRLRDGSWHDLEPALPPPAALSGEPVVGFGSSVPQSPPESGPDGDRLTMDLGIATGPAPFVEDPLPPPAEPFRFRASVARPGDTLLLCGAGLADPLRGEPELAAELATRWSPVAAPGLGAFLADTQVRVKGYADDRTAVGVWEA